MKKYLIGLVVMLLAIACSKKESATPNIQIASSSENQVGKDGGSVNIQFSSAMEWTASCSSKWCKLSSAKGNGGDNLTISVTCEENTSYDDRTATVTIKSGSTVSKSVNIKQSAADGLVISKTSYELESNAQDITINLQKNIDYNCTIDVDWITSKSVKALTSEQLVFAVATNNSTSQREGKITFESKDKKLKSVVVVTQKRNAVADFVEIKTPGVYKINDCSALFEYKKFEHQLAIAPAISSVKGYFRIMDVANGKFVSIEEIPASSSLVKDASFEAVVLQKGVTGLVYSQNMTLTVEKNESGLVWLKSSNFVFIIQIQ